MDSRRDTFGGDCVVVALLAVWLHFLPNLSECVTQRSYSMAHGNETQLSSMTAVWLLPIVSCVVAASSGAIVADVLPNPQHALWTVLVSYVLWGIGVPLAMMVMVIYLQRLTLHKLPPKAVIVSVFLPLGPLGQGGYG
jgi:tellurite resistance protein TehA-like permease